MRRDPYIAAWWLRRRNQLRTEGVSGVLRAVGIPLLAMVLLTPLVRRVFLHFLDGPAAFRADGIEGVVLRGGLVIVGWLSLDVYSGLIRGEGRAVLAQLPVSPWRVVRAQLLDVAVKRWWLLGGAAVVLSPLALETEISTWVWCLVALSGAYAVGLTTSATVVLMAVALAEHPRWAGLLDVARGNNPRAQAAFLYAPGLVLVAAGGVAYVGAASVPAAAAADPLAFVGLAFPFVMAWAFALPLRRLAERQWFRGSAVVADIDARYATLTDPEEALSVYLDWAVRFLPGRLHRLALNDLRHGWRQRRTLVTGAWLLGLLALVAGWTPADHGPDRVAVVVVLGAFLVAANGVLMRLDQPQFLVRWLPPPGLGGAFARGIVLLLWSAPVGVGGAIAMAVFHGPVAAARILGLAAGAAVAATVLAVLCAQLGSRSLAAYGPIATVIAVGLAALVGAA